jgi:hypothetical protein
MPLDRDLTKSQKRRIRDLAAIAYERDLAAELGKLEAEFRRWRANEIDAYTLSNLIHRFHGGPARELFNRYDSSVLSFALAGAIRRGVVTEAEAGPEALEALAGLLSDPRAPE